MLTLIDALKQSGYDKIEIEPSDKGMVKVHVDGTDYEFERQPREGIWHGKKWVQDCFGEPGEMAWENIRINADPQRQSLPPNRFEKLKCPHESFAAQVDVNRLEDSGRFNADVRIKCAQCGELFRFLGLPAGIDLNGASVNIDGTEAHLAIGTAETVANIMDGDCPVGFTVRRSSP